MDALDICCANPIDFFNNGMEDAEYDYDRQMLTINSLALNEVVNHFGSEMSVKGKKGRPPQSLSNSLKLPSLGSRQAHFRLRY